MKKPRGRPKSPEAGTRLHIYVPESLTHRISEIQRDTHASSLTEVIRNALLLYSAALEEHKNGGYILLKRPNEEVGRQLALFI
jgi:Ribbon-helix-helix protein, copG family